LLPAADAGAATAGQMLNDFRQFYAEGRDIKRQRAHDIMLRCEKKGDSKIAIEMIRALEKGTKTSGESLSLFVKACCRSGEGETALNLLENRKANGDIPQRTPAAAYNWLMVHFSANGDLTKVNATYRAMVEAGHEPNSKAADIMVTALVGADKTVMATKFVESLGDVKLGARGTKAMQQA
jgi:pentatricopeptide repeat protein